MPVLYSTQAKQALLANGLQNALPAGSVIEFRTGAQPASADNAVSGTLLGTFTLPASPWTISGTSMSRNGTWQFTASASGVVGHLRIRPSGDAGGASTTIARVDMDVGQGTGTAQLDNTNVATGQTVTINTLTFNVP